MRRTSLCQAWERKGSCAAGEECNYAHGEDQLVPRRDFKAERLARKRERQARRAERAEREQMMDGAAQAPASVHQMLYTRGDFGGRGFPWPTEMPVQHHLEVRGAPGERRPEELYGYMPQAEGPWFVADNRACSSGVPHSFIQPPYSSYQAGRDPWIGGSRNHSAVLQHADPGLPLRTPQSQAAHEHHRGDSSKLLDIASRPLLPGHPTCAHTWNDPSHEKTSDAPVPAPPDQRSRWPAQPWMDDMLQGADSPAGAIQGQERGEHRCVDSRRGAGPYHPVAGGAGSFAWYPPAEGFRGPAMSERWQFSQVQYTFTKVARWVLNPSQQPSTDDSNADVGEVLVKDDTPDWLHSQRAAPRGTFADSAPSDTTDTVNSHYETDFCYSQARDAHQAEFTDEEGGGSTRKARCEGDQSSQHQRSSSRREDVGGWQRLPLSGAAVIRGPGAWRSGGAGSQHCP